MRKLLRPQDILLLGLSQAIDIFEEIRDPLGIMSKSYENLYGWVPGKYKRHDFSHLVWRTLKTGYIEKIIKDDIPYLRLTSQGQKRIKRDFPLLNIQKRVWDKKWRLVIFDIAEVSKRAREKLRKKLKELGFGMLQKSVFISPYDIAEDFAQFIANFGLEEYAYVLEVSTIVAGNPKTLANKVWHIDDLNEKYIEVVEKIENSHLTEVSDRLSQLNTEDKEKYQSLVREVRKDYIELILKDPFLPKELLPEDWKGERVKNLIKELPE